MANEKYTLILCHVTCNYMRSNRMLNLINKQNASSAAKAGNKMEYVANDGKYTCTEYIT